MRLQNIEIGNIYELQNDPFKVKVIEKLPNFNGKNGICNCVKVIHSSNNDFSCGLIRIFKASEIKEVVK